MKYKWSFCTHVFYLNYWELQHVAVWLWRGSIDLLNIIDLNVSLIIESIKEQRKISYRSSNFDIVKFREDIKESLLALPQSDDICEKVVCYDTALTCVNNNKKIDNSCTRCSLVWCGICKTSQIEKEIRKEVS